MPSLVMPSEPQLARPLSSRAAGRDLASLNLRGARSGQSEEYRVRRPRRRAYISSDFPVKLIGKAANESRPKTAPGRRHMTEPRERAKHIRNCVVQVLGLAVARRDGCHVGRPAHRGQRREHGGGLRPAACLIPVENDPKRTFGGPLSSGCLSIRIALAALSGLRRRTPQGAS